MSKRHVVAWALYGTDLASDTCECQLHNLPALPSLEKRLKGSHSLSARRAEEQNSTANEDWHPDVQPVAPGSLQTRVINIVRYV
jgi:hypothetical protein